MVQGGNTPIWKFSKLLFKLSVFFSKLSVLMSFRKIGLTSYLYVKFFFLVHFFFHRLCGLVICTLAEILFMELLAWFWRKNRDENTFRQKFNLRKRNRGKFEIILKILTIPKNIEFFVKYQKNRKILKI